MFISSSDLRSRHRIYAWAPEGTWSQVAMLDPGLVVPVSITGWFIGLPLMDSMRIPHELGSKTLFNHQPTGILNTAQMGISQIVVSL